MERVYPAFPQKSPKQQKCLILSNTLVILFVSSVHFLPQLNSVLPHSWETEITTLKALEKKSQNKCLFIGQQTPSTSSILHAPHPLLFGFCRPLLCVLVSSLSWGDEVSCLVMEMDSDSAQRALCFPLRRRAQEAVTITNCTAQSL